MIDLKSLNYAEIESIILAKSLPKFRAKQIFSWLCKGVNSFEEMKNIPASVFKLLEDEYFVSYTSIKRKYTSKVDDTVKYLYELYDGELIESVVMKYKFGYSICVSSQVGCNMGCKFCASTIDGKKRDLLAGEILSQIFTANKDLGIRISNIVLMGMGEPLDNFDNVIRFLSLVSSDDGLNIGMRHISLSTCGLVDKIKKLMELDLQLTLSISLHAPFDEIRSSMMPVNNRYKIDELIKVCKEYTNKTNRRISFEYALVQGVNDDDKCVERLYELIGGMLAHINLIPVNPVHKDKFIKPDKKAVYDFCEKLKKKGLNATVRRTLGSDIDASCGQLRAKEETNIKRR